MKNEDFKSGVRYTQRGWNFFVTCVGHKVSGVPIFEMRNGSVFELHHFASGEWKEYKEPRDFYVAGDTIFFSEKTAKKYASKRLLDPPIHVREVLDE